MISPGHITLRGVEVHNLQGIDLDIPREKLIVFCGLSGSGKSSLALDTLYAEGQRRYIESFSAYTRQFLQRLEKPEAEHIDGIPPAIAVTGSNGSRSSRSTVGTATETADYLRLLFAKIGHVVCRRCGREVHRDSPQSIVQELEKLPAGRRFMVTFPLAGEPGVEPQSQVASLREQGFVRLIAAEQTVHLAEDAILPSDADGVEVVIDRLTAGTDSVRVQDSLETAFSHGGGRCFVLVEATENSNLDLGGRTEAIDGRPIVRSTTPTPSRGSTVSTAPWAPVRNAKALGTSLTSIWTSSCRTGASRLPKARSLPGTARLISTSKRN